MRTDAGESRRTSARNSVPSPAALRYPAKTTWTGRVPWRRVFPSAPDRAARTSCPSAARSVSRYRRRSGSLSTHRTRVVSAISRLLDDRDPDREGRPAAHLAPDRDGPSVAVHVVAGDAQAQARSPAGLPGGEKGVEHPVQILLRDSAPRVGDRYAEETVLPPRPDGDNPLPFDGVSRVEEEIPEHGVHPAGVAAGGGDVPELHPHGRPALQLGPGEVDRAPDAPVDVLPAETGFARVGESLQVREDAADPLRPLEGLANQVVHIRQQVVDPELGPLQPHRLDVLRLRACDDALRLRLEEHGQLPEMFPQCEEVAP